MIDPWLIKKIEEEERKKDKKSKGGSELGVPVKEGDVGKSPIQKKEGSDRGINEIQVGQAEKNDAIDVGGRPVEVVTVRDPGFGKYESGY